MGNAQDPLGYNNTTGVTGAVILTIQSGGQFVETGAVHASITTLNMTGGTIGSTGPGNGGGNIAVNGVWNVTSDTFGNPALIDATAIGMNGGSFNVSRGPGAVDMLITSVITSLNNDGDGMTKSGAGILELTGLNTYTGGTTVQGGILQLGSAAATLGPSSGALTLSGGTLDLHGYNPTVGALFGTTGAIDNLTSTASTVTIGSGGANGTFSATIQNSVGTLSLLKVGTGTQVLGGTNTYTGTTNVSAGILQFAQPAALYDSATGNWTAANITAGSLATLAVNVDNAGGFTPSIAGILLTNLTGTNSGLLKGAAFGIDTTNATAPVVFSSLIQDSAAGSVGLTKLGAGTLQVTNPANSYTGPTTVVNGQLMLFGANTTTSTAPGLVTVSNSTSGGLSILSLLNHDALGSGNTISALAPISLNSTGGGTAILEIGATLDPTAANSFSYVVVPAGTIPTAGQISLGSSANTQDVVSFSASSTYNAMRTMGLYTSSFLTTLQTLQFGTYIPGTLVLGSPTANTTLILENPIDLYSQSAGTSVQFSSIRGSASPLPEGEYAGAIGNSSSAPVNVTFAGNGGLIFTSSASSFNAANLQLAGGGLFLGAADYANGQAGPLGSGTSALVIGVTSGTSATASGANLAFMTYGPNSRIIGSNPSTLFTNRSIIVNPVPGNGSVVLGGFTDDYTAMNGSVQLNGPATFYAAQSGRVDFTGPISGSGGVQIGASSPVYVEGAGTTGIQLGRQRHDRLHRRQQLFRRDNRGQRAVAGQRVAVCLVEFQRGKHGNRFRRDPGRHRHNRWTGHHRQYHDDRGGHDGRQPAHPEPAHPGQRSDGSLQLSERHECHLPVRLAGRRRQSGAGGLQRAEQRRQYERRRQHARDPDHGRDFRHRHLRADTNGS